MYYLKSRYYNPDWGRFINADDNLGGIGDLSTLNIFEYCGNNPVSRLDANGHMFEEGAGGGGGDIGDFYVPDAGCSDDGVKDELNDVTGESAWAEEDEQIEAQSEARKISESHDSEGVGNTGEYASSAAQYEKLKDSLAKEEIQSVIETTEHGAERLMSRGFNPSEISDLKLSPDKVMTQGDGASVYIKNVADGKFNLIVESENGVVTALKNISQKSLDRLANNYGWE